MPFAATGRSKPHPTTAATSHSARTNHVSVPTPACLLASAASPSTSSSQTRPAPSARTATAPLSRASITCLKSWRFHSVEQPWRMARAAHIWYLRNTYSENNLIQPGKVRLKGEALDLGRIGPNIYAVGAEKDHIVPWDAAWRITQLVGAQVRFVLASSGHIAGMINPPGGKGTYWVSEGQAATSPQIWRKVAERIDGSWWTDWSHWLASHAGDKVAPPSMGSSAHPQLLDAPGSYVLEK